VSNENMVTSRYEQLHEEINSKVKEAGIDMKNAFDQSLAKSTLLPLGLIYTTSITLMYSCKTYDTPIPRGHSNSVGL
jgi:hypothetical protein